MASGGSAATGRSPKRTTTMARHPQPRMTTGTSTMRAVPRDAMVARSAVNSLSDKLMTASVAPVLDL